MRILIVLLALPLLAFGTCSGGGYGGWGWSGGVGGTTGPGMPPPRVPLVPMWEPGQHEIAEPVGVPGAPPPSPEPIDYDGPPVIEPAGAPPEAPYEIPESPPSPEPVTPVDV